MSFSSLIASVDATVASAFAVTDSTDTPVYLTAHLLTGDVQVPVVVKNPAMEEDFVPGMPGASEGTGNIILWVPSSFTTLIPRGSTVSFVGVDYDVFNAGVDREGGQTIKCRVRSTRWDQ